MDSWLRKFALTFVMVLLIAAAYIARSNTAAWVAFEALACVAGFFLGAELAKSL